MSTEEFDQKSQEAARRAFAVLERYEELFKDSGLAVKIRSHEGTSKVGEYIYREAVV